MVTDDLMKYAQSFGYNGYKRMFRCLQREFDEFHIKLENYMFDYFRTILDTKIDYTPIVPVNIKSILETYNNALKTNISDLGKLNNEYFTNNGVDCCIITNMIKCMMCKYEKTSRWIQRFNDNNWNLVDIHIVDKELHEKYKEMEHDKGYDY